MPHPTACGRLAACSIVTWMPALAALLLGGAAAAHDDGQGREWRAIGATVGAGRPTWEQVAAQCPTDGATPCRGVLGAVSLDGWVWATQPQVVGLFSQFAPELAAQPPGTTVAGGHLSAPAAAFQAALGITQHFQGCPTYQPCWNIKFSTGMTSSVLPTAGPGGAAVPWGGQVHLDLEWGGGGFGTFQPLHPDMARGLWMWRPTGRGTGGVHAYDDAGTGPSPRGGMAVPQVRANDWVAGQRADATNSRVEALGSSHPGVRVAADGSVRVAAGTPVGTYTADYRLCALADPTRCDDAQAAVRVRSFPLVARGDVGTVSMAAGGVAVRNVLANDSHGDIAATLRSVTLEAVSSTHPGVTLDAATRAVSVAPGTPHAAHALVYRICERALPAQCAQATVVVAPRAIDAVDDHARGSSKRPGTPVASVLANDRFAGGPARLPVVTLQAVSLTPAHAQIRLDETDGSVDVLGRTASGSYRLVYRICEAASPANCDTATVHLDLSGGE